MKILIKIDKNSLIFSYLENPSQSLNNLLNTNVIDNNRLVFSEDYIQKNLKIVSIFIKELVEENSITKIYVNNMDSIELICKILSRIKNIELLAILEEVNFTYNAYENIIKYKNIKKVNCYSIPTFMIELFDQQNIIVESRAEVLFTSNFINLNNLNQYSKIYYKMALRFNMPVNEYDLSDFNTFCKINKYLKSIHVNSCDLSSIDNIVKILIKNRKKNIKINIHENITDKHTIEKLKKINKIYQKSKITLKLNYSNEYIKNNYLKQIIITTFSYCLIIILIIIGCVTSFIFLSNKTSENNVNEINKIVKEQMEKNPNKDTTEITDNEETQEEKINNQLASLLELNKDTVGWITVPGTNINYPVVRTTNNDYYLNHNYNNESDYNGWVFMHYLNNYKELDKNTIIFAHNRFYSGIMFGTLNKTTKKEWYTNYKNNLITFDTLYEEGLWEVFSIYKINVTSDYLKTIFKTDQEWLDFIKLIKDRSIFKSDISINKDDKIITLSTCLDNNQRLVLHAVLKK